MFGYIIFFLLKLCQRYLTFYRYCMYFEGNQYCIPNTYKMYIIPKKIK